MTSEVTTGSIISLPIDKFMQIYAYKQSYGITQAAENENDVRENGSNQKPMQSQAIEKRAKERTQTVSLTVSIKDKMKK